MSWEKLCLQPRAQFVHSHYEGKVIHVISGDEFHEKFKPIPYGRDGDLVRFYNQTITEDLHHVWTILEPGDGSLYAAAGYHIVNCIGYVVTEVPWPDEEAEAVWFESQEEDKTS